MTPAITFSNNDTGNNLLPVTTTPAIIFRRCRQKHLNKIRKIFLSQKIFHFSSVSLTPVMKLYFWNIFANFRNNSKWPLSVLKEVAENLVAT
jgi:hypothetical protein